MTTDLYMLAQLELLFQTVAAAVKAVALFFCLGLVVIATIASVAAVTVHFARLIVSEADAWNTAHGIAGVANPTVAPPTLRQERTSATSPTSPAFPWQDAVLLARRPGHN